MSKFKKIYASRDYVEEKLANINVPEQVQADYNQNDSTAPDYIKNRTHGEILTESEVIVFNETTVAFGKEPMVPTMFTTFAEESNLDLVVGQTYTVIWDGTTYENLVCFENEEEKYLGSLDFSEYPFFVYNIHENNLMFATSDTSIYKHIIQITTISKVVTVKELDEKYIPDTIARVKDIPEQVHVDWNENDETKAGYVKNRTHWIENGYRIIMPEQSVSNSNNNKIDVTDTGNNAFNITVVVDGVAYNCESWNDPYSDIYFGDSRLHYDDTATEINPIDVPFLICFYSDTPPVGGGLSGERWIYEFTFVDDNSHIVEVKTPNGNVEYHPLDDKFIPETIARTQFVEEKLANINIPEQVQADYNQSDQSAPDYIMNKTHYDSEEILAEAEGILEPTDTTLKVGFSEDIGIGDGLFHENSVIIITINNTEYIVDTNTLSQGNNTIEGIDGYLNAAMDRRKKTYKVTVILNSITETTNIHLVYKAQVLKQLDEKFIPDTIARISDLENIDLTAYETSENAQLKLEEAKAYTDEQVAKEKSDRENAISLVTQNATNYTNEYVGDVVNNTLIPHINDEIVTHNTSELAHSDIRELISGLSTRLNALADSDDITLDQLSEIVAYIKSNKTLIESVTTNKINVSDIVDNLTTANANKVLSANQGMVLKSLIDNLQTALDAKVPNTRTINGKVLSSDITLSASDVGADASGSADSALASAKSYTDSKISDVQTQIDTLNESISHIQIVTWEADD